MIIEVKTFDIPKTFADFEQWEQPLDGYKYEWNDGEIIKFEKMKKKHLFLIRRLQQLFYKTNSFANGGVFIMEQDVMLTGIQMRRPDLAFFSGDQIDDSIKPDEEPIPEFVIEVISPTDDAEKVEEKIIEYFKAGVKVIWNVFPENKTVYVYTSRKTVTICTDDDLCSANPIMADFEISVESLFSV
jgi:Uma2 family endonuclease